MLNFSNLNDIEFEYLCKDVMSKMLGVELQRFSAGPDGGIDLTDDAHTKKVIVQVKHYIKTDATGLLTSLKKEIPKVKINSPERYYICCSKELTPQSKQDIYEMFSDYMESTDNIVTLIELNDFLEKEENGDILRKHFKLWIESTNILTDIFTNDICIDSDVLLSDIKESANMFVKTEVYESALACLEKNNVLIIIGNPGVGKTITSKMLVLYYAAQGYKIRYTTDGADLASLKKALSQSPDMKEVILLDDCFGQAYFSMKSTQENELLALIKHVNRNPNKLLVMNSRVTIYREASERTQSLVNSLDKKEYKAFVLDMTNVSALEKAKIFYNHLFFCEVPQAYRENIKKDKNYNRIVNHTNYNPRIIEFVTNKRQWESVDPDEYTEFILRCLNNPEQIWKNEYERRLGYPDRILLTTLYSLTNAAISVDVVKKCYEHRISTKQGIDLSINHFEQSIKRLQDSMVKIVDVHGRKMLSVANPSVNDFLFAHLEKNLPEREEIVGASICVRQLQRLLIEEEYEKEINRIFTDQSILSYVFESERQKIGFIAYYCAENRVLEEAYTSYLAAFVSEPCDIDVFRKNQIPRLWVLRKLFNNELCSFYALDRIIYDMTKLQQIILTMDLDEAIKFINVTEYLFKDELRKPYIETSVKAVKELIEIYCDDVSASEFDIDISAIMKDNTYSDERGSHIDTDAAIDDVDVIIKEIVMDEVYGYLSKLPEDMIIDQEFLDNLSVYVSGSSALVESYLRDDDYDGGYMENNKSVHEALEIEYIFER